MSLQLLMWRMVAVTLAFLAAVAASIAMVIAGIGIVGAVEHVAAMPDAVGLVGVVGRTLRGAVIAPVLATVVWPGWLIAALLGEVTATRSLVVHLIVAAGIAVAAVVGTLPPAGSIHVQATAAAGLVAGFVYWLVAGRSAGVTRRPAAPIAGDPRSPHD